MSQKKVEGVRGVRADVPRHGEGNGQRRSLDERLFVRFPAVYRLLARTRMRLPRKSRLRRVLLTRTVRRAAAALNRRDFAVLLLGFDPRIEFRGARDLLGPDQAEVAYGHEGYLQFARSWIDSFEDLRLEPEEFLDLGDMLLVTMQLTGHGLGSGVAMSQRLFQSFHLQRGLVVRQEDFLDRSDALQAVGLRD